MDELLSRLDLHEDDGDDFVWEEEADLPDIQAKWLPLQGFILLRVLAHRRCMLI